MVVTAAAVAVLTAETLATAASPLPDMEEGPDMAEDLDMEEGPDMAEDLDTEEGPVMEEDMATITEVTAAE